MSEEVNAEVGRKLVDSTDVVERMARYLGFKMKPQDQAGGMGGQPSGFQQGFAELEGGPGTSPTGPSEGPVVTPTETEEGEEGPVDEESQEEEAPARLDNMADAIADGLPDDADAHDIEKVVEKVSELEGGEEGETKEE
jgi:hypothetical protein